MTTLFENLQTFARSGRLTFIGYASERRAPIRSVSTTLVEVGRGLVADHHAKAERKLRGPSKRQVTLIQAEHLAVVAAVMGLPRVLPEQLRRNLVVENINLLALKDQRFTVGEVLLEGTGLCVPCSRMEEILGPGGFNAMRGHGGITARVLRGGTLTVGDTVSHGS